MSAYIVLDMVDDLPSRAFRQKLDESTVLFKVIITGAGKKRNFVFKLVVGPGDAGEPVITIMLPSES